LGKLGPPKPKAKEECFRLAGKNKGGKAIKSQARLQRRRDAVPRQRRGSAGDSKENKKPLLEATRRPEGRGLASDSQSRKKRFFIFWWLCRLPQYLLPDKLT